MNKKKSALSAVYVVLISGILKCSVYEKNIISALNEWDLTQAMSIAQEYMAKDPSNPEVSYLTGMVYFNMGEYYKASLYLEKAVAQRPDEKKWTDYYRFVKKVGEFMSGYIKKETEHFEIRFFLDDEVLARYLETLVEKFYKDISGDIFYRSNDRIIIEIMPTLEAFTHCSSLTSQDIDNSGAVAIAKFNRLMALSPRNLVFGYRWTDTIAHELTHYFIARTSRGVFPLWLHEGIASYESKGASKRNQDAKYNSREWDNSDEPRAKYLTLYQQDSLARAIMGQRLIPFVKMEPSLVKLANQQEVSLAFSQVITATELLIKKYGREKLASYIRLCGEIRDYKKAFKKTYELSMDEFEKEWVIWLSNLRLQAVPGLIMDSIKTKDYSSINHENLLINSEVRGYVSLGDEFFMSGKMDLAKMQYNKAIYVTPKNPVVLNKLGRAMIALENNSEAIETLEQSVKYNPDYANTYINLADAYLKTGKLNDALYCLLESNELNPYNPNIHKLLGLIYFNKNNRGSAIFEWRNCLKLEPANEEIKKWLKGIGIDVK